MSVVKLYEFYFANMLWRRLSGITVMPRKACGENIWRKEVWKRSLEIRKKHSENWLFEQEGAVGTGYPELCLATGKSLSVPNKFPANSLFHDIHSREDWKVAHQAIKDVVSD